MAYSESLADRVRQVLAGRRGVQEKKLFGGVGFLLHGHLCVCVWQTLLIVRLGTEEAVEALRQPHVRPFDVTGRPMKGWAMVEAEGLDSDDQLRQWIQRCEEFVATLPPK